MDGMEIVLLIYIVINLIAFAMYGMDKHRAVKQEWRIPESSLLTVSFFGAIGATAGMRFFRHKTRKMKFKLVYLFLAMNIIIILYVSFRM